MTNLPVNHPISALIPVVGMVFQLYRSNQELASRREDRMMIHELVQSGATYEDLKRDVPHLFLK